MKKNILIPAEHGAWGWLFTPFLAGCIYARIVTIEVLLLLIAALAAFFLRQPASVLLRIHIGKGNREHLRLALLATAFLAAILMGCLALLLLRDRWLVIVMLLPAAALLASYLFAVRSGRAGLRSKWNELSGAAGLGLLAPAAILCATGSVPAEGWILGALMSVQNVLAAVYVRIRIADTHNRPRDGRFLVPAHAAAVLAPAASMPAGLLPVAALLPFAAFLLRAVWASARPRPVYNIKRFGFMELGIQTLTSLWIAFSF